jgi:hypothetical protein
MIRTKASQHTVGKASSEASAGKSSKQTIPQLWGDDKTAPHSYQINKINLFNKTNSINLFSKISVINFFKLPLFMFIVPKPKT